MPKRYQVTPHQVDGRESYAATFRNSMGVRVHRGFGTVNEAEAGLIAAGLVRLWNAGVKTAADIPTDVPLKSVRLYFGQGAKDPTSVPGRAASAEAGLKTIHQELDRLVPFRFDSVNGAPQQFV